MVVVFCEQERKDTIRIISAHKATKREVEKNPYASKKKAVGINLSHEVIDYFKKLSFETGVPYQNLIDLYLLDWAA